MQICTYLEVLYIGNKTGAYGKYKKPNKEYWSSLQFFCDITNDKEDSGLSSEFWALSNWDSKKLI